MGPLLLLLLLVAWQPKLVGDRRTAVCVSHRWIRFSVPRSFFISIRFLGFLLCAAERGQGRSRGPRLFVFVCFFYCFCSKPKRNDEPLARLRTWKGCETASLIGVDSMAWLRLVVS